jgi:hypothetical protein
MTKKGKKVTKAARGRQKKPSTPRSVNEELGALARATIARLEAQDRRDREIGKRYENEPMISEPVWHVHKQ